MFFAIRLKLLYIWKINWVLQFFSPVHRQSILVPFPRFVSEKDITFSSACFTFSPSLFLVLKLMQVFNFCQKMSADGIYSVADIFHGL